MNCRYFTENLPEYLSGEMSRDERAAMESHAAGCEACRRELEEMRTVLDAITPQRTITPSAGFEERILAAATAAAESAQKTRKPRRPMWRIWTATLSAAAMVAVVLTVGLNTPARAARNHLAAAIAALDRVESMTMSFRVRTEPFENFAHTDPQLDFVDHRLQVLYTPTLMWRMEKGVRVAMSDGRATYQWRGDRRSGSINAVNTGILAELEGLINPQMLMHLEAEIASSVRGAKYELKSEGDLTLLTVRTPPQGDYSESDHRLYSSILNSDTRRDYTFSADGRLIAGRVTFIHPEGDRTLLEIDGIEYDTPIDSAALLARPEGMEWRDLREAAGDVTLTGITADEAAARILAAMERWEEPLGEALQLYNEESIALLRRQYEGVRVLTMQRGVRSGNYPGVFIPCTVLFRDGTREKLMVALRNDTPSGGWVIDGGI